MEETKQFKITTPVAIIIAGFLVMVGILLTNGLGERVVKEKTLSEQVGVSKDKLSQCLDEIDAEALTKKISTDVENAMKGVPDDQRGTPYTIVIGSNGVKSEIRGSLDYDSVKKVIDEVISGTVTQKYEGEVSAVNADDHILGNPNAQVVLIEYSDFECPYCKKFQATLNKIVTESNGNVSWVYRHWPIHQNSFEKLAAAECVAKIKGNDAFWKYSELLFGLLKTSDDSTIDQL
jgi:protein-disulfide isomerase